MDLKSQHLVIVRSSATVLNLNSYNCQEIGLARALVEKGLRTTVILAGNEYTSSEIPVGKNAVRVITLPFRALNQSVAVFNWLSRVLTELSPTIVQIHEFEMMISLSAAKWAKRRNIPVVMIQGTYEMNRKPFTRFLEKIFCASFGRRILSLVDAIGAKTPGAAAYLNNFTSKPSRITPVGLDPEKFADPRALPDAVSKLLERDKKILLYVGVIEPRRHPLLLAETISRLPKDYHLLIVGRGPQNDELLLRIKELSLEQRVTIIPRLDQNELPAVYRAANLFLLPTDYEIFGMVLLEAMYFGLPAIAHKAAGTEFLINSGTDGVILSDFDPEHWASTVQKLNSDPAKLAEMRVRCAEKISSRFVWSRTADTYLDLYGF